MKLKKFIIGGVLLGTVIALTGCGNADISVKTYEKESDEVQKISSIENTNENIIKNTTDSEKITNETKVNTTVNNKSNKSDVQKLKELLSRDWLEGFASKENGKVYFEKLSIADKDIYMIVVSDGGSYNTVYLVGKKNNEYVANKVLQNEQADVMMDMSNQNMFVVESLAELTTELYAIDSNTLTVQKFANSAINPNDGEEYWYVNDQNVSYGKYYSYFDKDNLKSTSTWKLLTKENIEKYIK